MYIGKIVFLNSSSSPVALRKEVRSLDITVPWINVIIKVSVVFESLCFFVGSAFCENVFYCHCQQVTYNIYL